VIAAAEAGNIANLHVFGPGTGKAPLQISPQFARAMEMTAHIRANPNLRFGRGREMEMRIETRHAVNLIKRSLRALGKPFEFRLGQETVTKLDGPQVVEDHVVPSRHKAALDAREMRGAGWSAESPAYY